jgi:hypothetical protein
VGVQNSIGSFAGVLSPAATGLIVNSTHAFTGAFLLAGAVSLFGVIGWVWMLPKLKEIRWADEAESADASGMAGGALAQPLD